VDGRPDRRNKAAFLKLSGLVWTGPQSTVWFVVIILISFCARYLYISLHAFFFFANSYYMLRVDLVEKVPDNYLVARPCNVCIY